MEYVGDIEWTPSVTCGTVAPPRTAGCAHSAPPPVCETVKCCPANARHAHVLIYLGTLCVRQCRGYATFACSGIARAASVDAAGNLVRTDAPNPVTPAHAGPWVGRHGMAFDPPDAASPRGCQARKLEGSTRFVVVLDDVFLGQFDESSPLRVVRELVGLELPLQRDERLALIGEGPEPLWVLFSGEHGRIHAVLFVVEAVDDA